MIELGTHITYTHQAAVVRKAKGKWSFDRKQNGRVPLKLYENGATKDLFWIDFSPRTNHVKVEHMEPDNTPRSRVLTPEMVSETINKSVVAWEYAGAGTVTGLVRKEIGVTQSGGGGTNIYGEGEWEPGWFNRYGKVDLYVVRHELRGTDFVYVPVWAAAPVTS